MDNAFLQCILEDGIHIAIELIIHFTTFENCNVNLGTKLSQLTNWCKKLEAVRFEGRVENFFYPHYMDIHNPPCDDDDLFDQVNQIHTSQYIDLKISIIEKEIYPIKEGIAIGFKQTLRTGVHEDVADTIESTTTIVSVFDQKSLALKCVLHTETSGTKNGDGGSPEKSKRWVRYVFYPRHGQTGLFVKRTPHPWFPTTSEPSKLPRSPFVDDQQAMEWVLNRVKSWFFLI